ncbi:helix-turn-helix domain-containing protein [Pseudonocardia sp. T1-2H]|uniref:helix-turn-helix domain-containing protein n=1 Tax=Pseudonocardia sp. T1-2H TaxID=3128899 RepID=UPI003101499B
MKNNPADTAKIRAAIYKSGLSQAQLARKIGLSDVAIHRYMTGLRKPHHENLAKLAQALRVDVRDLKTDD